MSAHLCDGQKRKAHYFLVACEVVTARRQADPPPALIPGVEFTSRAVPEQGKSAIHRLHSPPARDVGPCAVGHAHGSGTAKAFVSLLCGSARRTAFASAK
ncbi:hypothetical protein [Desulfovibrio sp. ZJ200]|uniref:hypothetical protein n=1 Tax=Desulfovibrio sp. ZJ200 TaxID=2709792 RepID=UPI0013EACBC7|nr:hypothetical protein [Desulfovibrio sp. ZJ200]